MSYKATPIKNRILKYVSNVNSNDCWVWKKYLDKDGYGQIFTIENGIRKRKRSNRAAYEVFIGEIPDGMHVLHKCDNRACCNPDHFFLGTQEDNMADKVNKNRQLFGEIHPLSRIDESMVMEIHRKYNIGYTQQRLSEEYNVSRQHIGNIISGKRWKHMEANCA